jgi:DNA-binding beta-propeller fold protein YncE
MKALKLFSAGGLALAAAALLAGPASAHPQDSGAVFVQTDDPAGNSVVAYDRGADGTLAQAGTYRTGGLGGVLTGSVVDHTASQGALAYDREHSLLYAVNAGSNTITVFGVDGDRLTRREILPSGGDFPVSVTTSGNQVFVLNARSGGTVAGFLRVGGAVVPVPAWNRSLGLDPNATPEFTHTPGQVAFTPDGRKLLVTTKANTNAIDVFDVRPVLGPSLHPVVNTLAGTVPFAVAFDARGQLAVAEAGTNAIATFSIDRGGVLSPLGFAPTGQVATCWIVQTGGRFYLSNAGSGSVSGFDADLHPLGNTATDGGTIDADASSDGGFLYVQTGAAGIVDEYRVNGDGSLAAIGKVTVPGAVGGEGIAAS